MLLQAVRQVEEQQPVVMWFVVQVQQLLVVQQVLLPEAGCFVWIAPDYSVPKPFLHWMSWQRKSRTRHLESAVTVYGKAL